MENHTAKNFVLQLGSLVSLYLSVSFLLVLLFGLINLIYPDPAEGYYALESASSSVRLGIAMVLVFLPTYLIVTRFVNKNRRATSDHTYLGLTKWLIYLSLLIGGITLLVDLVVVIMTFLEGDLTQRFILKAGAVLAIVGAAFHYYFLDAKGYWLKNEAQSIYYAIGMAIVALGAVIYGFAHIATPTTVREMKLDQKQVTDLQDMQYQIINYLEMNSKLPTNLSQLPEILPLPKAPEGRSDYKYKLTETGFALCAEFTYPSQNDRQIYSKPFGDVAPVINPDNWQHPAGTYCFERVVNLTTPSIK